MGGGGGGGDNRAHAQASSVPRYSEAVRYYDRAVVVLEQYKELDSFKGIYDECQTIMAEVVASVNALIDADGASMDQVTPFPGTR